MDAKGSTSKIKQAQVTHGSAISVKQHADRITALSNATPQQQQEEQQYTEEAHDFKAKVCSHVRRIGSSIIGGAGVKLKSDI